MDLRQALVLMSSFRQPCTHKSRSVTPCSTIARWMLTKDVHFFSRKDQLIRIVSGTQSEWSEAAVSDQ